MSERQPKREPMRQLLRRYLLDTLEPAERDRLEKQLAASPAWREALEAERQAMSALDGLPESRPDPGLAAAVMRKVRLTREQKQAEGSPRNWRPMLEFALAMAILGVLAALLLPALTRARESAHRSSSQNNLKQMGLIFKMYANETPGGFLPPLAPYEGVWMADLRTIYPDFLSDIVVLVNPSQKYEHDPIKRFHELLSTTPIDWEKVTRTAAESYVYLGYVVRDDDDVKALVTARSQSHRDTSAEYVEVTGRKLFRLKEGVELFFTPDTDNPAALAQVRSTIPVMLEASYHVPKGKNVLYLDGHVAFVRYGTFPCTRTVEEALCLPLE